MPLCRKVLTTPTLTAGEALGWAIFPALKSPENIAWIADTARVRGKYRCTPRC